MDGQTSLLRQDEINNKKPWAAYRRKLWIGVVRREQGNDVICTFHKRRDFDSPTAWLRSLSTFIFWSASNACRNLQSQSCRFLNLQSAAENRGITPFSVVDRWQSEGSRTRWFGRANWPGGNIRYRRFLASAICCWPSSVLSRPDSLYIWSRTPKYSRGTASRISTTNNHRGESYQSGIHSNRSSLWYVHSDRSVSLFAMFSMTHQRCSSGLCIRVRLLRSLPERYKVDIVLKPGSHQSENAGVSWIAALIPHPIIFPLQ